MPQYHEPTDLIRDLNVTLNPCFFPWQGVMFGQMPN